MIYLFNVVQLFKDFNSEFVCVAFEFLIIPALYANYFEFFKALVLVWNMSSSKLKSSFGVGGWGFPVGFGVVIKLCLMMSSLTPFRGTGSLTLLLLGFLASCFNGNSISCNLLNLLRSFLFISI